MFGVYGWLLTGFVLGVLARLITPRDNDSGVLARSLIGISGAGLGGMLAIASGRFDLDSAGAFGFAVLGATAGVVLNALAARYEQAHSNSGTREAQESRREQDPARRESHPSGVGRH